MKTELKIRIMRNTGCYAVGAYKHELVTKVDKKTNKTKTVNHTERTYEAPFNTFAKSHITEYAQAVIETMVAPTVYKALKIVLAKSWTPKIEKLLNECVAYMRKMDMVVDAYDEWARTEAEQDEGKIQYTKTHRFKLRKFETKSKDGKKKVFRFRQECIPYDTLHFTNYGRLMNELNIADGLDVEDLFQECRLALCELVYMGIAHNPAELKESRVYAFKAVHAAITKERRTESKHVSLTKSESEEGNEAETDIETNSTYDEVDRLDALEAIEKALAKRLDKRCNVENVCKTMWLKYYVGMSNTGIASELGVTEKAVRNYDGYIKSNLYSIDILTALHDIMTA